MQLLQVVDRFVSPGLAAPVRLVPLGEVPMDAAVRESVQRRQLLMDAMPGSPAAVALGAAAARLLPLCRMPMLCCKPPIRRRRGRRCASPCYTSTRIACWIWGAWVKRVLL